MLTIGWSAVQGPGIADRKAGRAAPGEVRGPFGRLLVLWPEAHAARTTLALLLDPSGTPPLPRPVSHVRLFVQALEQVVRAPGDALAELMQVSSPFEAFLPAVPSRGGTGILRAAFEPLGYAVTAAPIPLDSRQAGRGHSNHASLTLQGSRALGDFLAHLIALLPVLDDDAEYAADTGGIEDVLLIADPWGRYGPERPVVGRYLRRRHERVHGVLRDLTGRDDILRAPVSTASGQPGQYRPIDLGPSRIEAVVQALRAAGAGSVLDAGCGSGELLQALCAERQIRDLAGVDASTATLAIARQRLGAARAARGGRCRVRLLHGSLQYDDPRLHGFEAVTAVEVIEHFDAARLELFAEMLFSRWRPRVAVLTTPNADFNVHLPWIPPDRFRHWDHRFEWARAEFASWSQRIAERFGFRVECAPVGPEIDGAGAPTQMAVFERVAPPRAPGTSGSIGLADVTGRRVVRAQLCGPVVVTARRTRAVLEHLGRFTVDPRWLIYLPPAMIAASTKSRDLLAAEDPAAAFDEYRRSGVSKVALQEKHAGTRAVMIVCRDREAASRRFGVGGGAAGCCYARRGQRLFHDGDLEAAVLAAVRGALETSGFWQTFGTDWVCLEGALMPRSYRAQRLLRRKYAPIAAVEQALLRTATPLLDLASRSEPRVTAALERSRAREVNVTRYIDAYHRSCRSVESVDDVCLALFHVLATDGAVYVDKDHHWHTCVAGGICARAPRLLRRTTCHLVDLTLGDEGHALERGKSLMAEDTDGVVVKPWEFVTRDAKGMIVQPALKCRTGGALLLELGPDESRWEGTWRALRRKDASMRPRATGQFALGLEALDRFVRGEPLRAVHECVVGVLALEATPAQR